MFQFLILLIFLAFPLAVYADTQDLQAALANPATLSDIPAATRTELSTFYAQRNYRPAWSLSDAEAVKKTLTFIDSVEALVAYHGLIKSSYPIETMRKLASSKEDAEKQKLEFLITASLIRLAHDLHGDTVNLETFYTGWDFHRQDTDILSTLGAAITGGTLEMFFDKIAPQNQAYRDLAHALQAYTAIEAKGGWPYLTLGPSLRPEEHNAASGNHDPRVTQLRARLVAEGYDVAVHDNSDVFDDDLVKALTAYQTRNGLLPDGHAGAQTQEALDTPVSARITQIRANMERWRHMPESFPPDRYTVVNIPDFTIAIFEDGSPVYHGIVIDGRPDRQTPFINSKIVNMVVDPSWHVPVKIARKDILPKLRRDPHYLEKLGFIIPGRKEDPSGIEIDWKHMADSEFDYQLRQAPGDLNSLGKLKFNFANPFDVYMHGTPHQELFEKAERDFSSGCVRLEDPVGVGEILLEHTKDEKGIWSQPRIQEEIDAGETHWVSLAKPIPVYFLYWSVFLSDDGQINFRKDIYGYDQLLMDKMKNVETGA